MRRSFLLLALAACAACSRDPGLFVEANARAHVGMLAGTIGSRPLGSPNNARARAYIVDQLKQSGFEVRVQETDARRHELGRTARVSNIIGLLPGGRREAIGLVSHYDSVADGPGATDDALGVAVSLEAARLAAASAPRQWSLFVLITDGEESGLMGAAALLNDREVMDRLRAYVNLESIGSAGTAILFESGPGNAWIVAPWARTAPHPQGASYAIEVYRRLPNDTDFSILKTRDAPGLNFAAIGDSYAYHTARDTPDRLSRDTVRRTGENTIAVLQALQRIDITQRSPREATFFDVGRTAAITYGPAVAWLTCAAALLFGVVAWVRFAAAVVRQNGFVRWLLTFLWTWLGAAAAGGAMVAATWLLRSAREVYHPWYARPGRLFFLLVFMGATAGWSVARLGQWLPRRAHPSRHPALTWTIVLPAWIAFAALALWLAPAAAFLWVLPLLAAGVLLNVTPPHVDLAVRLGSLLVFIVCAALWLQPAYDLLRFLVAVMGRLPLVTPVFVYAALIGAAAFMLVPPLVAALAAERPLVRPWALTSLLLIGTVVATAGAYLAPAYTHEEPLRRQVRALQESDAATAIWEVASVEPGLDLGPEAPSGWMPAADAAETSVPWGRYTFPFVFRTAGPSLGPAPAAVSAFDVKPLADGLQLTLSIVPREAGLTLSFVLPAGVTPARSSLPGVARLGRWTATYVAPPPEGIGWEASFRGATADQLRETRIAITSPGLPGGGGPQRLPAWLPETAAVWSASVTWVVPATTAPAIAPVPPLR